MTLDEIVNDYIRTQRPYTREEMRDFENETSPSAAIRRALFCETKEGKRHAHQRRIPRGLLEHVEMKLQAIRRKLSNAANFAALHRLNDPSARYGTGMRPGEAYRLRWEHVLLNCKGPLIQIAEGKTKAAR